MFSYQMQPRLKYLYAQQLNLMMENANNLKATSRVFNQTSIFDDKQKY